MKTSSPAASSKADVPTFSGAVELLDLVRAEATKFGRCCDQYQDGLGTFCCHECGQRTMAMLSGVQAVLGVSGKDGSPVCADVTAQARKDAIMRNAAPALYRACELALTRLDDGTEVSDKIAEHVRAALKQARGE